MRRVRGSLEYLISWEGESGSQHCNAAPGTLWYRRKMLVFSSRTVRRGMRVNAVQMHLLHYSVTWCNFLLVSEPDSHESTSFCCAAEMAAGGRPLSLCPLKVLLPLQCLSWF